VKQVLQGDGDAQAENQIVQQVHLSSTVRWRSLTPSEVTSSPSQVDPSRRALRQPDEGHGERRHAALAAF
ncbi:MAG TPA: hypothetical protein VE527_19045, partial [Reyranella sp.]|nr:hypothetical protein [Reyranella sp.]